jgi:hypothetical protein
LRVFARPVVVARHLGPSYTFDLFICVFFFFACWDIDYTGWAAQAAHLVLSHNGFARAFPSPEHYTQLKALILELVCKAVVEYTP